VRKRLREFELEQAVAYLEERNRKLEDTLKRAYLELKKHERAWS
jgi:hypothetical protein